MNVSPDTVGSMPEELPDYSLDSDRLLLLLLLSGHLHLVLHHLLHR